MSKGQSKETQAKRSKLISTLMRELLDISKMDGVRVNTLKPVTTVQRNDQNTHMIDFEDRFEKKSTEDMKSEEQLSQSPISGKPSPFIGSMRDLNIIRPFKKETLIRNKSWDNFCFSTIFLENRYRKALKHSKVLCNIELFDITTKISEVIFTENSDSFS